MSQANRPRGWRGRGWVPRAALVAAAMVAVLVYDLAAGRPLRAAIAAAAIAGLLLALLESVMRRASVLRRGLDIGAAGPRATAAASVEVRGDPETLLPRVEAALRALPHTRTVHIDAERMAVHAAVAVTEHGGGDIVTARLAAGTAGTVRVEVLSRSRGAASAASGQRNRDHVAAVVRALATPP